MLRCIRTDLLLSVAMLVAGGVPAAADVTISNAATQNISCASGVCTPTAEIAVLNVNDLEGLLASGNTTVTTTGSGVQAKNIRVVAKLSWSASNSLTLDAYNSIMVEKPVNVAGAGGVSVITNDGGSKGEFSFGTGGNLTFANPSSSLAINGTAYTLESSIASLASAISANPSGAFALADSYDASKDGTYATPPISTVFAGSFNGLGNTISNLTINDPTQNASVGLFAETSNASLSNIRLTNANVTGGSGSSQDNSTEYIGSLVGAENGGTIYNALVAGSVSGGSYAAVGGLAGVTMGAVMESGAGVATSNGYLGLAGGLIGVATGAVTNSYAAGNVSGSGFVGGVTGDNEATVNHSFATGTVTGIDADTYAGGLVGLNDGTISTSSASGGVNCEFVCAGLVGDNGSGHGSPTISRSFASGNVSAGPGGAGGLVGLNLSSVVEDSYAIGSTSGDAAGALVVTNLAEGTGGIARAYASGAVTGTEYAGGLIAVDDFEGSLKKNYWDMTTTGITNKSQGAGNIANDPGIRGLSDAKLKSKLPNGFNPRIWAENPDINGGLPYLIDNPPPK